MGYLYLPEHIIHQIFLQMPTKPLVRLKCLSKHWNRVILDPSFMKSRSRRMIFLPTLPFHAIDNPVIGVPSMIKLFSPLFNTESHKVITIVGSFNGIVLLALKVLSKRCDHDDLILYNPFSGEFKKVPYYPPPTIDNYYMYGFGYGTAADDLKIVRLRDFKGVSVSSDVFNLKTWSWSMPSELLLGDYYFSGSSSGIFANGFLYWEAVRKRNRLRLIVALDIKKMVFSEIDIEDDCWLNRLGTYNGRLCMICKPRNVVGCELRVKNEHETWSTVCSLTSDFGSLCILDDGKLLMSDASQELVIYDMFKNSYKEVNAFTVLNK